VFAQRNKPLCKIEVLVVWYLFFNWCDIQMMVLLMENYNTCIEGTQVCCSEHFHCNHAFRSMSLYPSAVDGIVQATRVLLRFTSLSPMSLSVFFKEIYRLFNLFNGLH